MSEENNKRIKIKKLKKNVTDYSKLLNNIEIDIDKFHDYTSYQKKLINNSRKRSSRVVNILGEFEKKHIYPVHIMNDLSSLVSGAMSSLSAVHSKWDDINQDMYGFTGFMSTSNLNMASGDEIINLYLEEHKDQQPILQILETYPVEKSMSEKIKDLQTRLRSVHENLVQRLNEISNHIVYQNSFSSLISIGNLISGFIKEFLKIMAPDEMVIRSFQKKSPFFRCLFTIIGFDLNYDKKRMKYEPLRELSQRYVEIRHDSDRIKHEHYIKDISKLRYKVNKNIQEMVDYTNRILDLREIHYKEESERE